MKKSFVILILFVLSACAAFGQMIVKSSTNAELMRVTESGNVGIGVTNPREALAVVRAQTPQFGVYSRYVSEGATHNTAGGLFSVDANDNLHIKAQSEFSTSMQQHNIFLTDLSGGNVGIGTTTPLEKLHVNGDVALGDAETVGTDQELYVVQRPTDGVGYALTIRAGRGRGVGSANRGGTLTLQGGRTGDTMPPYGHGHVILQPSTPDNTGLVGIGTDAPAERLDVNGAIRLANTSNVSPGNEGTVRFTGDDFEGYLKSAWVSLTQGGGTSLWSQNGTSIYYNTGHVGIGSSTPGTILEIMNANTGSTDDLLYVRDKQAGSPFDIIYDRFIVKKDGKVGIGTASPSEQLSIIKSTNAALGLYTQMSAYGHTGAKFSTDANGDLTVNALYTLGTNPTVQKNIYFNPYGTETTSLVGIGTTAPLEKLDVAGAIHLGSTTNTNDGTVRFTGEDFEGRLKDTWVSLTQGGGSSLWSQNGTSIYYNTGHVGIGTTAPQQKLMVLSSATNQFGIYKEFNPPFYRRGAQFFINTNDDLQIFAREEYQDSMSPKNIILTNADETGSVGIGVLNPIAKLDVVDPMAAGSGDLFMVRESTPGSPFPIIFTRFAVKNDGFVGVNTHTTPYTLTVDGPAMLHDVQDAPKPTSGYAGIYTSSGELYAMDDAGNSTQLSPHDKKTGDWIFYSKNVNTGRVVKVNMEKLVKKIEELTGEKFMEEFFDQE